MYIDLYENFICNTDVYLYIFYLVIDYFNKVKLYQVFTESWDLKIPKGIHS